jgi:hypothetical protein
VAEPLMVRQTHAVTGDVPADAATG